MKTDQILAIIVIRRVIFRENVQLPKVITVVAATGTTEEIDTVVITKGVTEGTAEEVMAVVVRTEEFVILVMNLDISVETVQPKAVQTAVPGNVTTAVKLGI